MSSECDVVQRFYDAYHLSELEGDETIKIPQLEISLGYRTPIEAKTFTISYIEGGCVINVELVCKRAEYDDLWKCLGRIEVLNIPIDGDKWCCEGYVSSVSAAECLDGDLMQCEMTFIIAEGRLPQADPPLSLVTDVKLEEDEYCVYTQDINRMHWVPVVDKLEVTNCILVDDDEVKPFIDWRSVDE